MFAKLRNYIITGFLITLPLIFTVVILVWLFVKSTNLILDCLPLSLRDNNSLTIAVRFITPVAVLIIFALVGMITKIVFIKKLFGFGDQLLVKIPLFNKVYIALKQISYVFLARHKNILEQVVLVEYPRKGLYAIGFVTVKTKGEIQDKTDSNVLNIFVPTTPNPTSGVLIFAKEDDVIKLDMSIEEGLKLVVSGGTVNPPYNKPR